MTALLVLCLAAVALTYVNAMIKEPCHDYCPYGRLPNCCTCRRHPDDSFPTCAVVRCDRGHRCVMIDPYHPVCVPIFQQGRCRLPPVQGNCYANLLRFYFNTFAGRCLPFWYGGCGGNANRFLRIQECRAICGGP